jgi:arginyl-tRNA synthetase
MTLLDEAVNQARAVIDERRPDLEASVRDGIAPQIGVGAVKYADLAVAHDSEYVFDLAQAFSAFYENCPVLKAEPRARESRLALCALTLQVLVQGLDLLGVQAPELM